MTEAVELTRKADLPLMGIPPLGMAGGDGGITGRKGIVFKLGKKCNAFSLQKRRTPKTAHVPDCQLGQSQSSSASFVKDFERSDSTGQPENSEISSDGGSGQEETRKAGLGGAAWKHAQRRAKELAHGADLAAFSRFAFPCCCRGCARWKRAANALSIAPRLSKAPIAGPMAAAATARIAAVTAARIAAVLQEPDNGPKRAATLPNSRVNGAKAAMHS